MYNCYLVNQFLLLANLFHFLLEVVSRSCKLWNIAKLVPSGVRVYLCTALLFSIAFKLLFLFCRLMEGGQLDFESAMNKLQGRQTSEAAHFYSIIQLE